MYGPGSGSVAGGARSQQYQSSDRGGYVPPSLQESRRPLSAHGGGGEYHRGGGQSSFGAAAAYASNHRYLPSNTPTPSPIGALAPVDTFDASEPAELAYLRDQYNAVRMRARELTSMRAPNPEVVEARAEATKLYSALATVLYTSISLAKVNQMDRYVRRGGRPTTSHGSFSRGAAPSTRFYDASEWEDALNVAKGIRDKRQYVTGDGTSDTPMRAIKSGDDLGSWMGEALKIDGNVIQATAKLRPRDVVDIHSNVEKLSSDYMQMSSDVRKRINSLESQLNTNAEAFKSVIDKFANKMKAVETENKTLVAKAKAAVSNEEMGASQIVLLQRENEALQSALQQERQVRAKSEKLLIEKQRMEYCDLVLDHSAKLRSEQMRHDAQLRDMAAKHEAETQELLSKISTLESHLSSYSTAAHSGRSEIQEIQDRNKQLEDKLAVSKQVILDRQSEVDQLRAELAKEVMRRDQLEEKDQMKQKHMQEVMRTNVAKLKEDLAAMEADYKAEKVKCVNLEVMLEKAKSSMRSDSTDVSGLRSTIHELDVRAFEETSRANRLSAMLSELERNSNQKLDDMNRNLQLERDRCAALLKEQAELVKNVEQLQATHEVELQSLHNSMVRKHSFESVGDLAEIKAVNAELNTRLNAVATELQLKTQEMERLEASLWTMDKSLTRRLSNSAQSFEGDLVLRTSIDSIVYSNNFSMVPANMSTVFPVDGTQGGYTGWYRLDDFYYYFCRVDDLLVLLGGPVTPQDYNELRRLYPCHIAPDTPGGFYAVDKSFIGAMEIIRSNVQNELIRLSERIMYLESELSDVMQLPEQVSDALSHIDADGLADPTPRAGELKSNDSNIMMQRTMTASPRENMNSSPIATQPDTGRDPMVVQSSIPDVVYVAQKQVPYAINSKAITSNTGILVPVLGDKAGGSSGWYLLENQYYYFCRVDNELVLHCGPLIESEYQRALQLASEAGTDSKRGRIDLSALYANNIVVDALKSSSEKLKAVNPVPQLPAVDYVNESDAVILEDESPRKDARDVRKDVLNTTDMSEANEKNGKESGAISSTVTAVIIKMLRKEIQHLKKIALQDSQSIAALKGKSLDEDDYIHIGPSRQISVASLLTDDSSDEPLPVSARHPPKMPGTRPVASLPAASEKSTASGTSVSTPKLSNQVEITEELVSELRELGNNLRLEVQYLRGLLLEDSLLISALKAKLGISDDEEIEIPGYTGVNVLPTDQKDAQYISAKLQDNITVNLAVNEDHNNVELKPVVQLQHKVHILKNLLVQQGGEVRSLLQQIDELQKGGVSANSGLSADALNSGRSKPKDLPIGNGKSAVDDVKAQAVSTSGRASPNIVPRSELTTALNSLWAAHSEITVLKRRLLMFEAAKQTEDYVAASGVTAGPPSVESYAETKKFIRIQAMVRGFLTRTKINNFKKYLAAKSSGVLFAMKHTKQGESGWYAGPDGSLFYFILDNNSWILVCGPIDPKSYEEMILRCSTVTSGGNRAMRNNVLVRCSFSLSNIEETMLKGELYMSAFNHKLLIAMPMEDVIVSDAGNRA